MILTLLLGALISSFQASGATTPQQAVSELLDADRAFARAATQKTPLDAIAAMFAEDVTVPVPGSSLATGKQNAISALKANAANQTGRINWAPVRGGISGDGLHGFTLGYMTHTTPDGKETPLKYLAYWVKGKNGWRVAAYNRRQRAAGPVSADMLAPSLPARMTAPSTDAAAIATFGRSLSAAERAFSDEAQKIGLGAAFAKHGRADAVNMGGPNDASFVVGAEAIGRTVGEGTPTDRSEVEWSADRVLVASSGDLGITFGMIRVLKPEQGKPSAFPFFTIWRRDSSTSTWSYIAE